MTSDRWSLYNKSETRNDHWSLQGGTITCQRNYAYPEQQAERREEIIGVALRLIEKNGFQKTSNAGNRGFSKHGKVQSV